MKGMSRKTMHRVLSHYPSCSFPKIPFFYRTVSCHPGAAESGRILQELSERPGSRGTSGIAG
jgi:hypothetical protein